MTDFRIKLWSQFYFSILYIYVTYGLYLFIKLQKFISEHCYIEQCLAWGKDIPDVHVYAWRALVLFSTLCSFVCISLDFLFCPVE